MTVVQISKHLLTLLTPREREIMALVATGLSNKGIARQLKIEASTTKLHIHNIFQKLQISNRVSLAVIAFQQEEKA